MGKTMLSFVVLLFTLFNFSSAMPAMDKKEAVALCMQQHSITEEMFNYFKQNGQIQDESSTNQKCSFLCLMTKLEMGDDNGNLNLAKMKEYMIKKFEKMSPENVVAMVDKCGVRSETDPCDKVYQFHKCTMKSYMEFVKG